MRYLTLSLLLVALIATIGLGWLFDQLYDHYQQTENTQITANQNTDDTQAIEKLGLGLAKTLDVLPNRNKFIQQWQKNKQAYTLSLTAVKDVPLPIELLKSIKQGTPLLLETSNNLAFHYYLPISNELLILKLPLLSLSSNLNSREKAEDDALNYFLTFTFYFVLLLLFLLWASPLVRQLLALRKAAKAFGEGNLKQRINLSSISYIRDIETEFNHMAQRIENLVADVKLLSSAVSHDLRTPLARIRFGIDTLKEEDDPILRRSFEEKISNNVDEMTSLVETLLSYSRLEQTMLAIKKKPVNLSQLIRQCVNSHKTEGVNIRYHQSINNINILADKNYMNMLVNNLLTNAINYGEGEVLISLKLKHELKKDCIELVIADNGDGIQTEQCEKIFLPFVRDNQNIKKVKGHGVGLAIVKRIIEWHHGNICINRSIELSGAEFLVQFPVQRNLY